MKFRQFKSNWACMVLVWACAALVLFFFGCSGESSSNTPDSSASESSESGESNKTAETAEDPPREMPVLRRDGKNLAIAYMNVESGGNDPASVASDLVDLGKYHVFALSEVEKVKTFADAIKKEWDRYDVIEGRSGRNKDEADDHLVIVYDSERLYLVSKNEIEFSAGSLQADSVRQPLVAHFRERSDDSEFFFIVNHFEEDQDLLKTQAAELAAWAKTKPQPVITVGTFNFGFDVAQDHGDDNFNTFSQSFRWVKPLKPADTQWTDSNGDGNDDQADTISDFAFVSGRAKKWDSTSRILGDARDLPDDEKSSNHRPLELLLRKQ